MQQAAVHVQRAWRRTASHRHALGMARLRDASVCVVCHDECTRVVRCVNGHAACLGCALASGPTSSCAVCREARHAHVDRTLTPLMEASSIKLRCGTCSRMISWRDCETHRAWCPSHRFACPFDGCNAHVRACDLSNHVYSAHQAADLLLDLLPEPAEAHTYSAILAMRPGQDAAMLCVGPTVVVVHLALPPMGASEPFYVMSLRGYYEGPQSPALHVRLRQHRMETDTWMSEHNVGVVPPVLASRELTPYVASVPLVHACVATQPWSDHPMVCASMSWQQSRRVLGQSGVRDALPHTAFRSLRGAPVVIVALVFEPQADVAVSA